MSKQDFSKCKVGDRLWSIQMGECVVAGVGSTEETSYPLHVTDLTGNRSEEYTADGKIYANDHFPSLFFSAIPRPPVRHEIPCFVNVYQKDGDVYVHGDGDRKNTTAEFKNIPATLVFELPAGAVTVELGVA